MKQILLIEDNEDHAELIERSLDSGLGKVRVHLARRTSEALKLLADQEFDLILSDYYLPDGKGETHIKKLAENAPDTPIIIITGQGDEKTAARSIKAGADDYIVKTRNALKALPQILNRTFAKHQSNLGKKKLEIKKQLKIHETTIKKVIDEVEKIEHKMSRLKKLSSPAGKKREKHESFTTLDALVKQVNSLKKFVQKTFFSG
jgi:DNA-binding NtrC family response regulator